MILTRPLRKPFWIINSFLKKHKKVILYAGLVGGFIFLLTKNLIPLLPQIKPSQKIGLVGQYQISTLPHHISSNISRGLMKVNEKGNVEPDLVKSWKVLENETLYRIYLKPDNLWSDGTIISSKDIVFNFPEVEVSYPDELTVEFKLKESYSPFLVTLTQPLFKNQSIGAGEYMVKKIKYNGAYLKSIELVSSTKQLTYRFYSSNRAAWLGYRLGEVDQLKNLIINPLRENWENKANLEQSTNKNQYLAILFNLQNDKLSSKALRQALAYAIKDKSTDEDSRALTSINPNSWAYNSKVKPYDYNQEQAQDLFDKAMEEASISGQLEISLVTSQSLLGKAESIAQSWKETLDIKVNVSIINAINPNFEAVLVDQEIPLDPDQYALWHSTQPGNITHYSDLKVDKLLEDGRKISAPAKRTEIYQDFQRFLLEDVPAIFLSHPTNYTITRN